jgi:hypothetical protein
VTLARKNFARDTVGSPYWEVVEGRGADRDGDDGAVRGEDLADGVGVGVGYPHVRAVGVNALGVGANHAMAGTTAFEAALARPSELVARPVKV